MLQAPVCDGGTLDLQTLGEDCLGSPEVEVDVSRREIIYALVIADVVIMVDEGAYLPFKVARQVIVFEQDSVLQGLMPALDLSLGLGMIRRPAYVFHAFVLQPLGRSSAT
jgi:hypothetical protein